MFSAPPFPQPFLLQEATEEARHSAAEAAAAAAAEAAELKAALHAALQLAAELDDQEQAVQAALDERLQEQGMLAEQLRCAPRVCAPGWAGAAGRGCRWREVRQPGTAAAARLSMDDAI